MKRRFTTKFMSIALMLSMVIVIFPLAVSANEAEEDNSQCTVDEVPFEFEYLPGDLTHEELKTAVLDPAEKPSVVSQAQIDEMQHVNRLYEQETDDYTVIFQNRDGGKTVYVFDRPVKSVSESGEVCDLSANAIVVASKKNTAVSGFGISSLGGQTVSAASSNLKEMQNRLEAYKTSHNLNEYQMLPDKLQNATLTTAGLSTEMLLPMQISESNSVSVMSLTMTYSEFGGVRALKQYGGSNVIVYSEYDGLVTVDSAYYSESWIFSYQGNSQYVLAPNNFSDISMIYHDGDSVEFAIYPDSEPTDEYLWTVNLSTYYFTLYNNGAYFSHSGDMTSSSAFWQIYVDFPLEKIEIQDSVLVLDENESLSIPNNSIYPSVAVDTDAFDYFTWYSSNENVVWFDSDGGMYTESAGIATVYCRHNSTGRISNTVTAIVSEPLDIVSERTHIIRPYASTNAVLATKPLLTMKIEDEVHSLLLNSMYVETANYQTAMRWNTKTQAFTFVQNNDGSYRITAIMSTDQYMVPFMGSQGFEHNGDYDIIDKNDCLNTLIRSGTTVTFDSYNTISNNTVLTENSKWYVYKENGATYICAVDDGTVSYLNYDDVQTLSGSKSNSDWSVTFAGVDAPAVKQVNDYFCGVASTLQTLITIGDSAFTGQIDLNERQRFLNGTNYINAGSSGATKTRMTATLNAFSDSLQYINVAYSYNSAGLYTMSSAEKTLFKTRLINTLLAGSPVIFHETNPLPYYNINDTGGHYITIIGYDPVTDNVILSDVCYWDDFGIHAISFESLCARCKSGYIYAE